MSEAAAKPDQPTTAGPEDQEAFAALGGKEADYVVVTTGRFDLLVEIVCADRRGLLDMTNRIRSLPEVVSTETFLYLELWKQLYDWGVGERDAAVTAAAGETE